MIENSQKCISWITIDDWYVFLYFVYVLFASRASKYVFSWDSECL